MPKIFTSSDSDLNSIKHGHSVVQNSSYTHKRGNEVKLEGTGCIWPTGSDFTRLFPPKGIKRVHIWWYGTKELQLFHVPFEFSMKFSAENAVKEAV